MGRLIKYLFILIVLLAIFLLGYSFVGDLSAPTETISKTIPLPNAG
ncbi:hypothetical protein [Amylibacter marinus]|nr:hypothetical protein [Amylibacter marinus]